MNRLIICKVSSTITTSARTKIITTKAGVMELEDNNPTDPKENPHGTGHLPVSGEIFDRDALLSEYDEDY
jgi:hypothetical protein